MTVYFIKQDLKLYHLNAIFLFIFVYITEYERTKKYIIRKKKKKGRRERKWNEEETETGYCLVTALERVCVCLCSYLEMSPSISD